MMSATPIPKERIEELWFTNMSNAEIQSLLGVTKSQLNKAKRDYRLPSRQGLVGLVDPDEETIAERARVVRMSWTPAERARRLVGARRPGLAEYGRTTSGVFVAR